MATTIGDSLYYPVQTDSIGSLHTVLANMQNSNQVAFNKRQRSSYVWANQAAREAQSGMTSGATGWQMDTGTEYVYNGTIWQVSTPHMEFTSTTSMVNSYAPVAAFTVDSAASTSSTMATAGSAGQIVLVQPGIYAITVTATYSPGSATTGTLDIARSTSASSAIIRSRPVQFLDVLSASIANYRTTTGSQSVYINGNSGGNTTASVRVAVTRLG